MSRSPTPVSPEDKQRIRIVIASVVALLAVALVVWQIRATNDRNKNEDWKKTSVAAGPLANSTPVPEDVKLLQELAKHPEWAKKKMPSPSSP